MRQSLQSYATVIGTSLPQWFVMTPVRQSPGSGSTIENRSSEVNGTDSARSKRQSGSGPCTIAKTGRNEVACSRKSRPGRLLAWDRFRFVNRFHLSICQRVTIARLDRRIDPNGHATTLTNSARASGPAIKTPAIPIRQTRGANESAQTGCSSFSTQRRRIRRSRDFA